MARLDLPFRLRGLDGSVSVEIVPNEDPASWGYELLRPAVALEQLAGYPVCSARVSYPARGYAAVLGWIQFVQSSDSEEDSSSFELDPIYLYRDIATPFAWFGVTPILFDAPSRETRSELSWRARSYLCVVPDAVISREVQPVCGFGWGFDIDAASITTLAPTALSHDCWSDQLETLRTRFPAWSFLA